MLAGATQADVQQLEMLAAACRESAAATFHPWLLAMLGHAQLTCNEIETACATLREARAAAERLDMVQFQNYAMALLACSCSTLAVAPGESEASLENTLGAATDLKDPWIQVLVLRAMADRDGGTFAIVNLESACRKAEASGFRPELARTKLALDKALGAEGDPRACAVLNAAADLLAELGLKIDEGEARQGLAKLRTKRKARA